LSGGEQQMLAIGRALLMRPKVVMIDELSAGLAPVIVDQLVDGLARLRETGLAVLLVEQSPHLVVDVVDRVYVLDHGRIDRSGTFDSLGGVDAVGSRYLGIR
jgi:branched-chain amino acid transport system ATP-binding protein